MYNVQIAVDLCGTNYLQKPNFKFYVLSSTRKANITSMIRGKMGPSILTKCSYKTADVAHVSTERTLDGKF